MRKTIIKITLFVVIICIILVFFFLDLQQYATLESIKQRQYQLLEYYQQNSLLVISLFAFTYIIVTALSLPAAAALTLLSGALFGLGLGLIIASFSSTIGATLAFLIARFLARDYIQKKYAKTLIKINQGFAKEGAFYLFALRLVPAFPFFMINVVMALLPIKGWTFYWVSQLGMLLGTATYVYAGTQLAQIQSLTDILSPPILIAFALLGLLPLLTKKLLQLFNKEKNYE